MNDLTTPQSLQRLECGLTRPDLGARLVAERPGLGEAARQAAVLALFSVQADETILTVLERSHSLRHHAGQIAFPGGGVDPEDASVEDAALREADEEIALRRETVRLLGALPAAHVAVSGFDVTTVVGWWFAPHEVYARDRGEVESVHHIPVSHLVDPDNRRIARHPSGYRGPAFLADDLFIWGLTAHLLDGLLDLAGWSVSWNRARQVEIPARFMRDRSRAEPGTDAATH
ncbi:MAG: CoA pyrophosphatase [Propionibacteriaceae bacterium]|nr:CoA pyrophosphatase [Propionibacteriaceae bacterium]